MAIDRAAAAETAARVAAGLRLDAIAHVATNDSACVFRAESADGPVAIKIHSGSVAWASETEVLGLLRGTGAPVPRLLAVERTGPLDALVMSWLPGRPLLDVWGELTSAQRFSALDAAGAMLGEMHRALEPEALAAARFWRQGGGAFAPFSWPRHLAGQIARWRDRIVVGEEDRRLGLPALLSAIDEAARRLPATEAPALLHRDFSLRNLMFADGRPTAIIDFASAALGDPIYDLAKLPWLDLAPGDTAGRDALLAGWERSTGARVDRTRYAFYLAVQALAAIGWADRRGGNEEFRARARRALIENGEALIVSV